MSDSADRGDVLTAKRHDESDNKCVICCGDFGKARAVTKCDHTFCTECLLNSVAKNSGTEEGSNRNKCPLCREQLCDSVVPSAAILIHIDDMKEQLEDAKEKITDWDKAYHSALQFYRSDKLHLVTTTNQWRAECNMYKKRAEERRRTVENIGAKCALLEQDNDQSAQQILKLQEQLKIANFTSTIRQEEISKLRASHPKKVYPAYTPPFTFGKPGAVFSSKIAQPNVFVFKGNTNVTPTKFNFG